MISIQEIDKRVNCDFGPYEWIHPADICGFNPEAFLEKSRSMWFATPEQLALDLDEETLPDLLITKYLNDCIEKRNTLIKCGQSLTPRLDISGEMLIDAAIFIMVKLGSHYPATMLDALRTILDSREANYCLKKLKEAYTATKEDFVAESIRDFTLMQYEFGALWDNPEGRFREAIDEEGKEFLEYIYANPRIMPNIGNAA